MKESQFIARELQDKEGDIKSWTENGNDVRDKRKIPEKSCTRSACVSLCRGFKLNKCFAV